MKKDIIILAVDVGKYENLGIAWNQPKTITKENFIESFCEELEKPPSSKAIVAIEAPLFIPSGDLSKIAKARENDIDKITGMSRPWSMSACFSCGIQFLDIFFSKLPTNTKIYTSIDEFEEAETGILICEAFISGGSNKKGDERKNSIKNYYSDHPKLNCHNHDAKCAVSLLEKMKKIREIGSDQKYINLPYLLTISNQNLEFCGKTNTGIIVKSPKPCFEPQVDQQEILKIIFN